MCVLRFYLCWAPVWSLFVAGLLRRLTSYAYAQNVTPNTDIRNFPCRGVFNLSGRSHRGRDYLRVSRAQPVLLHL